MGIPTRRPSGFGILWDLMGFNGINGHKQPNSFYFCPFEREQSINSAVAGEMQRRKFGKIWVWAPMRHRHRTVARGAKDVRGVRSAGPIRMAQAGARPISDDIRKRRRTVCKPGSVPAVRPCSDRAAIDGYSSGTPIARRLVQPTRMTGGRRALWCDPLSSLFDLAPGGACRAAPVARRAVRSYRTVSPLPPYWTAVCSLWRFPSGSGSPPSPAGRYPAPCLHGARTFLDAKHAAAIRPSDRSDMRRTARRVNAGPSKGRSARRAKAAALCGAFGSEQDRSSSKEKRRALDLDFHDCIAYLTALPLKSAVQASWRSGYAADCKSVYAGSIPADASNKINTFHRFLRRIPSCPRLTAPMRRQNRCVPLASLNVSFRACSGHSTKRDLP